MFNQVKAKKKHLYKKRMICSVKVHLFCLEFGMENRVEKVGIRRH